MKRGTKKPPAGGMARRLSPGVWADEGEGPNGELCVSFVDGDGARLTSLPIPHKYDPAAFIQAGLAFLAVLANPASRRPVGIARSRGQKPTGATLALVKGGDRG